MALSRLIMMPARRTSVRYADGDTTNLRRDNLVITKGCGKGREKAASRIAREKARARLIASDTTIGALLNWTRDSGSGDMLP